MNDLDTVNAIRNAKSAVEAIRILRKHVEEVVNAERKRIEEAIYQITQAEEVNK